MSEKSNKITFLYLDEEKSDEERSDEESSATSRNSLSDTNKRKRSSDEEQLSCCAVCGDTLKDLVSTSCEHWFCRECIRSYWDQSSGHSLCPQCGQRSKARSGPQTPGQTRTAQMDGRLQDAADQYKTSLKKKCEHVIEGTTETGSGTPLNKIYTELCLTEGQSDGVKTQLEVGQLHTDSKMETVHDTPIKCQDIFRSSPDQQRRIRVVLTHGVAGVGKTFLVQKFCLDWAEGLRNQDVGLLVLVSFRQLNLLRDERYSLLMLLQVFHPAFQAFTAETLAVCKLLFIFDGLHENRLSLDFHDNRVLTDVSQKSSVSELLTNLIKGNLLPSALVWITSRPAASSQIPLTCIDRITEVRGFTEDQREAYFRRRFKDEDLSSRIISHVKASRSLHVMCQIPIFCWITAAVLEHEITTDESKELPETLTDMYIHFLMVQPRRRKQKHDEEEKMETNQSVLGGLLGQTETFGPEDIRRLANVLNYMNSCDGSDRNVSIFQCLTEIHEDSAYQQLRELIQSQKRRAELSETQCSALVFILLMSGQVLDHLHPKSISTSVEGQRRLLLALRNCREARLTGFELSEDDYSVLACALSSSPAHLTHLDMSWMKMKDSGMKLLCAGLQSPNCGLETVELRHCELSVSCCESLGSVLTSEHSRLRKLDLTGNDLLKEKEMIPLLAALPHSRLEMLRLCGGTLSENGVGHVISALQADVSRLRELELSELSDSVLNLLCAGLEKPNHQLESLCLSSCGFTDISCAGLTRVLKSKLPALKTLDLSHSHIKSSGLKLLSPALTAPSCFLQTLRLRCCELSDSCCSDLASVLKSRHSRLKDLDLSNNFQLQDSGIKLLSAGLQSPYCHLQTLRLFSCSFSNDGCHLLTSALRSNPSHLRELDVGRNALFGAGMRLSAVLETPQCRLETLSLSGIFLTERCCTSLSAALKCNPAHLRCLDLSKNPALRDGGVKQLAKFLENPKCHVEILKLKCCSLTEDSCASLVTSFTSNPSRLRELELTANQLKDAGVKRLSDFLKNSLCKLEILRLCQCDLTVISCSNLALALSSNPSHLRELDLSENNLNDLGLEPLTRLLYSPRCRLDTLSVQPFRKKFTTDKK